MALQIGYFDVIGIQDVWSAIGAEFESYPFTLITQVDSISDLSETTSVVDHFGGEVLGPSILVETAKAVPFDDDAVFNGFDEIWLFAHRPSLGRPADAEIDTGPEVIQERPVLDWMNAAKPAFGLGDGVGTRFVTLDPSIALRIFQACAEAAS